MSEVPAKKRETTWPWWALGSALLCLALALQSAWPVWLHPSQGMVGNVVHPDCAGNHWLLVWVAERLAAGEGLLHNDRYYWPVGDMPFLAGNGGEGILYLPFHLAFGWPTGANLFVLILLAANGWAAVYAARSARASWPGAVMAGAAMTVSAYALREAGSGRFSQADLVWQLLFLGTWLRFLRRPGYPLALAAAALLAVTAVLYWYYGLFMVLAGGLLLMGSRLELRLRGRREPLLGPLATFGGTSLLLIALPLGWYLWHWAGLPGAAEEVFPHPEAVRDSLDPAWPFLVRWGRFVGQALPGTVVLLAAVQLLRLLLGRSDQPGLDLTLLVTWGVFLLLAMGPRLTLLGWSPFEALYGLAAPTRRFWWPSRHIVVCSAALTLLAARGTPALGGRWRGSLWAAALGLSCPLLLHLQGLGTHLPSTAMKWPPAFYRSLAEQEGDLLLELPLSPRIALSQKPLLYQHVHGKTLVAGHGLWVERVRPAGWDVFVAENSFLRGLQAVEDGRLKADFAFLPTDLEELRAAGMGVVVLNREHYPAALLEVVDRQHQVLQALFGAPVATMRGAWAWHTSRWTGLSQVALEPWELPPEFERRDDSVPKVLITPRSQVFQPPPSNWSPPPPKDRKPG